MRRIYLLPNVITAVGLSCGLFVIFKMTMLGVGLVDEKTLMLATAILILAALADLLDGFVARAMNVESSFGGFFDSMADAITFGVAPSVVVLKTFSVPPGTTLSFWMTAGAMIFSVCGVLRLVRFSTSPHAETDEGAKKNFTGMPIPAAAAGIVSLNLYLASSECLTFISECIFFKTVTLITAFFVLGYFMISRWKFPSLKGLNWKVGSFRHVLLTVMATLLIFFGFFYRFPLTFLILAWGYLILGWTLSIIRIISGKKSKTLVDFEPEDED